MHAFCRWIDTSSYVPSWHVYLQLVQHPTSTLFQYYGSLPSLHTVEMGILILRVQPQPE